MLLYRELSTENDECMFLVYLLICMHLQSNIGGFFPLLIFLFLSNLYVRYLKYSED